MVQLTNTPKRGLAERYVITCVCRTASTVLGLLQTFLSLPNCMDREERGASNDPANMAVRDLFF